LGRGQVGSGSGPFYLRVHNQGPTRGFEAIAVKVIGVESAPPQWHIRWNQSSARRQEILRGQEWALMVGEDDVAAEADDAAPDQRWRFFTPTDVISVTPPRSAEPSHSVSLRVTIRVIPVDEPEAAKENTVSLMFTPQGRSISWDHWRV
jgi:hypothetical protein